MAEKGGPLPKFGEWDVNDPASAEGFTVIFNKARDEKKTGCKLDSPVKDDSQFKHGSVLGKPQSKNGFAACKLPMQNHRKLLPFKSFARKELHIYAQLGNIIQETGAY